MGDRKDGDVHLPGLDGIQPLCGIAFWPYTRPINCVRMARSTAIACKKNSQMIGVIDMEGIHTFVYRR